MERSRVEEEDVVDQLKMLVRFRLSCFEKPGTGLPKSESAVFLSFFNVFNIRGAL